LTEAERTELLGLLPVRSHCDDADCPLEDPLLVLIASARERLEGKSTKALGLVGTTNFGRDTHEAALGSTVMSVQLSVSEIDLLRTRLDASDVPLRSSLVGKLELLRNALEPTGETGQSLAAVAASVGLGGASPSIVPVTVLTGCLGAGKTTVIRSLLRQLPAGYTCAWLKNEYGDAGVDRMVAQDARVAVKEIVNGCLCCTKVGELADSLKALHELRPHRSIHAEPRTLAFFVLFRFACSSLTECSSPRVDSPGRGERLGAARPARVGDCQGERDRARRRCRDGRRLCQLCTPQQLLTHRQDTGGSLTWLDST
jgi:hypothetical protein